MRELPLACSLNGAAMTTRFGEMRSIGRDALVSAQPGGVLRFRAAADVRSRLKRIVAAETRCCPFLALDLTDEPDALRLTISAPDGAEPVVAGIVEAFSG